MFHPTHKTGYGGRTDLGLAVGHLLDIVARPARWGVVADERLEHLRPTLTADPYPVVEILWLGALCDGPRHLGIIVRLGPSTARELPPDARWVSQLQNDIHVAYEERGWPRARDVPIEFQAVGIPPAKDAPGV